MDRLILNAKRKLRGLSEDQMKAHRRREQSYRAIDNLRLRRGMKWPL